MFSQRKILSIMAYKPGDIVEVRLYGSLRDSFYGRIDNIRDSRVSVYKINSDNEVVYSYAYQCRSDEIFPATTRALAELTEAYKWLSLIEDTNNKEQVSE